MLITYVKGGTPAQIVLERGSAMTRATFVIFLSSFIDWCCYYTQVSYTGSCEPLVSVYYYPNVQNVAKSEDNFPDVIALPMFVINVWLQNSLLSLFLYKIKVLT